jgi:pimeloyl-ACP methyl ester carboxylesterase
MKVSSTDGVEIAVHDLGGIGPRLLVSHATGFHGRCYEPLAAALADRLHSIAFDYRGHGDTPRHPGDVDWQRYGDDAEAMAVWLVEQNGGQPIDAFGHSMGGACLLMAAHRQPHLFRRLVLFEPIVFPPQGIRPTGGNPLVEGARRRRSTFPSYQAAIDNFAAKPPLNTFTPEALRAYVLHGFAEDADGVHLKCRPETEAATFEMGPTHDTYDRLPEILTDVLVVAGRVEEFQPSKIAREVADRLPHGRYLQLDELDHFGPMVGPDLVAEVITDALTRS